ncbi:hypothetical protein [Parendozoicomonas sp. Alg238-R29]|uniref:hypothetical protein n=1 Tax=Parendozoicomonas sp. Alg238-R29 TaxID=2993446 RepID=UPI00248D435F|nr:hypothetical protein [Parendozoicomonas sp. Alg238-R29]
MVIISKFIQLYKAAFVFSALLVLAGCANQTVPEHIGRTPAMLWQTHIQDGLSGPVQETMTTGTMTIASLDGDRSLLPSEVHRYSPEGIRTLFSQKGSQGEQIKKTVLKGSVPIRKAEWKNGTQMLKQSFRYSPDGDLTAIEPPVVEDASGAWIGPGSLSYATGTALDGRQADFFYGGDFRMIPGSRRQAGSPCWSVGYLDNKVLLKACDDSRMRVQIFDTANRLIEQREIEGVPKTLSDKTLLESELVWGEWWQRNTNGRVSVYTRKEGEESISTVYSYQNGELLKERKEKSVNGRIEEVTEKQFSDYQLDDHGNWTERKVKVLSGKTSLSLKRQEEWKRRLSYY